MTNKELVNKLIDIAQNYKTLYVKGCFGAPLNDINKRRYTKNTAYNKKRADMINSASDDTFGFDCINLIKGVLWGWDGNVNASYGGARYCSNGVPDIGEDAFLGKCFDVSTDFSHIEVGEYLWLQGHAGVYIGNGLAMECSPKWKNGVQITAVANIECKRGYNARVWSRHGKMPYITYEGIVEPNKPIVVCPYPEPTRYLRKRLIMMRGEDVKWVQWYLLRKGFLHRNADVDGYFGSDTSAAVIAFQKDNGLEVDGIVGEQTRRALKSDLLTKVICDIM